MPPVFRLGEKVSWFSQANGSTTEKQGYIMCVVPPGITVANALHLLNVHCSHNCANLDGGASARAIESYVVEVLPPVGSKAKPKLYWPRVEKLRKVEG